MVGQQVSVAAANSIWNKLEAAFGSGCPAEVMAAAEFDALRACGLSGQKQSYAKSLAQLVLDREPHFTALPGDAVDAIALTTKATGIGRWLAESHLPTAAGPPHARPPGDH